MATFQQVKENLSAWSTFEAEIMWDPPGPDFYQLNPQHEKLQIAAENIPHLHFRSFGADSGVWDMFSWTSSKATFVWMSDLPRLEAEELGRNFLNENLLSAVESFVLMSEVAGRITVESAVVVSEKVTEAVAEAGELIAKPNENLRTIKTLALVGAAVFFARKVFG